MLEHFHNLRKTSGPLSHGSVVPLLPPLQDIHRCVHTLMVQALPQAMLAQERCNAQEGKNELERENMTGNDGGML